MRVSIKFGLVCPPGLFFAKFQYASNFVYEIVNNPYILYAQGMKKFTKLICHIKNLRLIIKLVTSKMTKNHLKSALKSHFRN